MNGYWTTSSPSFATKSVAQIKKIFNEKILILVGRGELRKWGACTTDFAERERQLAVQMYMFAFDKFTYLRMSLLPRVNIFETK